MAKLKNIIRQLSEKDYRMIHESFIKSSADKSAYLLKAFRERQLSDSRIMETLEVNANAYYTLRSRVSEKIEEYLLLQVESPRTSILKKVANLNEVVFTRKRTISITTLKKLEKDLINYDLASELTTVYRVLKRAHVNSQNFFTYSQLYNRHVAYMLATDKVEDLVGDYFKKYGQFFVLGQQEEKEGLVLIFDEIRNMAKLYKSHRLYVYQSFISIFHYLFVEKSHVPSKDSESIEDMFVNLHTIFTKYNLNPLYYHLNIVLVFLKLEYYSEHRIYDQEVKYIDEVNDAIPNLLMNYCNYTFAPLALISKLKRHLRMDKEEALHTENETLLIDYEPDPLNVTSHIVYTVYMAFSSYYINRYDEAAILLREVLQMSHLKKHAVIHIEIRALLALQYCMMYEFDLFIQTVNSVSRQIRTLDNAACRHILLFIKILRIAVNESKQNKYRKMRPIVSEFNAMRLPYFAPTKLIRMDEQFIKRLVAVHYTPTYKVS